jgi:hypothetical protein
MPSNFERDVANTMLDAADKRIAELEAERDHLQRGFNAAVATVEARDKRIEASDA